MEKHLTKCPVVTQANAWKEQPYYQECINTYPRDDTESHAGATLSDAAVWERIKQMYAVVPLQKHEQRYNLDENRHWEQNRAIAEELLSCDAAQAVIREQGTVLLELGAGKGHLSRYVHTEWNRDLAFVLVDFGTFRHKGDTAMKRDHRTTQIHRIRMDIQHLSLEHIPMMQKHKPVLCVTKHLCGSGIDFAIRALEAYATVSPMLTACAFATCCHGKTVWEYYTNQLYFMEHGIGKKAFETICYWSSWGTNTDSASEAIAFDGTTRGNVGRQCKAILDHGRSLAIQKALSLQVHFKTYTDIATTPENHMILAFPCE